MLKFLLISYLIGSVFSLYVYILGDKCAHYKYYRNHKTYNELDFYMFSIVFVFWPFVIRDFFKDKETFHFTRNILFYTKTKAKKYL